MEFLPSLNPSDNQTCLAMIKRSTLLLASVLLMISNTFLSAQNTRWATGPKTGFVFQITNDEAQRLLTKSRPDTIINAMLHTQTDTFNIARGWTNRPEKGHFILVTINENKLHCEYTGVFPYQVLLLKTYGALALQVLDHEGNVRSDARVKFRTRRIRFDGETSTYRIENDWFNGRTKIVTVELDGFRSVFNIDKHEVPSWAEDYYYNDDSGPDFYSYMITDKNKYKPSERVRFKSYALSGSRTPIRRDLEVWLLKQGRPIKVTTISPHRPGSFAGEIHLHDSLGLVLDQYYTLQLCDKSRRVISSCTFRYEDYELKGNKLKIEAETTTQYAPASNRITILATDENGLVLKDARATINVITENIREVFDPLVILPDTLMSQTILLDPDEETEVGIPSSLFGKSNTGYRVHVTILNSENQRIEAGLRASHYFSRYELKASFSNDSIMYEIFDRDSPMQNVTVKAYHDNATEGVEMILPHKEKINPALTSIRFESELLSRTLRMSDMLPKIHLAGGIEKDSFNVAIENLQQIAVSWYVYQGNELLEKGSGTEMEFKSRIENRELTYYVELLYSFGGSDHVITKEFPFRESSLNIAVNLPDRVYPGQKVDVDIEVTDDAGNPVSNVDLTAFATTAKLNYYVPDLPYYGTTSKERSPAATYTKHEVNKRIAVLDLNYELWAPRARLDTMKYYQLIYPGRKFFFHKEAISDSTQFVPYALQDGAAKQVYVIEINHKPVYFSWTGQPKGYSFYVAPDEPVQITLRLHDRVVILDSLTFERGKKTIFSFDLNRVAKGRVMHLIRPEMVRTGFFRKYRKWTFTTTEINRYSQFLATFNVETGPAYLTKDNHFVPLATWEQSARKVVAGPVEPGMQTYTEHRRVRTTYKHAGMFSYTFEDNIVYKTDIPNKLTPERLPNTMLRPSTTLNDVAINKEILLRKTPFVREPWHPQTIDLIDHACRIKVLLPHEEAQSGVASVLFQDCTTNITVSPCRSYSGGSDYFTIPRGCHHVIVLYNNGTYFRMNNVNIRAHTQIVSEFRGATLHDATAESREWLNIATGNCFGSPQPSSRTLTFESRMNMTGNLHGTVLDDTNSPLPGANVVVKGTTTGAIADVNGRFVLDVPDDPSTIVVSFIGYVSKEVEVRPGTQVAIIMEPDVMALQEVVVVGYGMQMRSSMTASAIRIRGLSGKVAGINSTWQNDAEDDRTTSPQRPDEAKQAERKLYEELLALKDIRANFSDVGFWEPRLWTDRHGRSSFTVTFPDDITRWDAVVYGMNRRLQTGTARKSIRSYKPLMAELEVPRFLVAGDTCNILGKVVNHSSDKTIQGSTQWSGPASRESAVTFDSYHKEVLTIVPASTDTITTRYSFTRDDGYFDGEERKIPVIPHGTLRADGTLSILENGDELHVTSGKGETVNVEIVDNQLELYAREARYLINYRYDCNEQLASKLIGLVNYKLLMQYEGKPFKHDKDVNRIIARLLKNQNSEFLWSWWDVSPNTSYWMSAHILRALKAAKDAGYTVKLDIENVTRKATYKYVFLKNISFNDIQLMHALAMWQAPIDYARYVRILDAHVRRYDSIARENEKHNRYTRYSSLNEKLMLLEIRQLTKLPWHNDSLLRYKKETILKEVHFADVRRSRYWYSGDLSGNAIAYRIIARDSALRHLKLPMQMYFIRMRSKGSWNTYESSNVLMSILPDMIAQGASKKAPARIGVSGKQNGDVTTFPYRIQLDEGESISLRKESGLPLYCMQYKEERVTKAKAGTDGFTIQTSFDKKTLEAGVPIVMKAIVIVKRDTDLEHVMIEIPIPGGCSYADKHQPWNRIETHREYFQDRTVIFCQRMTPGTYVFQVHLLPRFTGTYHVNPAQISLMYFPVINANCDSQLTRISD